MAPVPPTAWGPGVPGEIDEMPGRARSCRILGMRRGRSNQCEKHPSGAKALLHLGAFAARLKSCPFKAAGDHRAFRQPVKSCPFKAADDHRAFRQPVKSCPFKAADDHRAFRQPVKSCPFKAAGGLPPTLGAKTKARRGWGTHFARRGWGTHFTRRGWGTHFAEGGAPIFMRRGWGTQRACAPSYPKFPKRKRKEDIYVD
jgi:hypothetical protein